MKSKRSLTRSPDDQVNRFLAEVRQTNILSSCNKIRGRLVFALDATASRQPTWDQACQLQAEMFVTTERVGDLAVQLAWYRGFGEFHADSWSDNSGVLVKQMSQVYCAAGITQIAQVLQHALDESRRTRINALVFVGDCVEESTSELYGLAGQLGILQVPVFAFHEGRDPHAAKVLREIARLSNGAYASFDNGSAQQLRDLLTAAAIYSVGGQNMLRQIAKDRRGLFRQLTQQLD